AAEYSRQTLGARFVQSVKENVISLRWVTLIVILLLWQVAATLSDTGLIPTPARVGAVIWEALSTGLFFRHLAISLVRILSGFGAAMLVGTILGVLMGSARFWDEFFQDIVIIGLSLPALVYALLSVVVFGLSLAAPIVAISAASFPFVAVNIREGVRTLDKDLIDMSRSYKVGRSRLVTQVILPSLVPFFLAAIRVGFTIAWKVAVLTEVVGATSGIGYMINIHFDSFSVRGIIAWALMFGGVMLVIEYLILAPAERYFARWRPQVKQVI
ncbi:MAG: ABC transporter permease, partial [Chloroflexota bacterium]